MRHAKLIYCNVCLLSFVDVLSKLVHARKDLIQSRENLVLVKTDLNILANRRDLTIADVMETCLCLKRVLIIYNNTYVSIAKEALHLSSS